MRFFSRLTRGWQICLSSFAILNENKRLILFPLLSGLSLLLISGTFATALFGVTGWSFDWTRIKEIRINYGILFGYYLVTYFILVFFNTALMYCARSYFKGGKVSVAEGLHFSLGRITAILSWSVFAATIGFLLKLIQENVGFLGRVFTNTAGIAWSIATFFVVPVIAYENAGPLQAFKRSAEIMKQKWGESLGATFSFGLIQFTAILLIATPLLIIGFLINVYAGLFLAALGSIFVISAMGAAQIIFISAVYHDVNGGPARRFNRQLEQPLFVHK
ncbi:MAG: DUF6159 family protein [Puia sp.]|nr:DUF6159 family protein [Puia sp.]